MELLKLLILGFQKMSTYITILDNGKEMILIVQLL